MSKAHSTSSSGIPTFDQLPARTAQHDGAFCKTYRCAQKCTLQVSHSSPKVKTEADKQSANKFCALKHCNVPSHYMKYNELIYLEAETEWSPPPYVRTSIYTNIWFPFNLIPTQPWPRSQPTCPYSLERILVTSLSFYSIVSSCFKVYFRPSMQVNQTTWFATERLSSTIAVTKAASPPG